MISAELSCTRCMALDARTRLGAVLCLDCLDFPDQVGERLAEQASTYLAFWALARPAPESADVRAGLVRSSTYQTERR